jgi:hypothetical protein
MQEQSGWREHAAFTDGLVAAGFFIMGGPLADNHRVVIVVNADTEDQIRSTLVRDPWSEADVRVGRIEEWSIKFDGRSAHQATPTAPYDQRAGRFTPVASGARRLARSKEPTRSIQRERLNTRRSFWGSPNPLSLWGAQTRFGGLESV